MSRAAPTKLLRAVAVGALFLNTLAWFAYPTYTSRVRSPVPDPSAAGFARPLVHHGSPVCVTGVEDGTVNALTILSVILFGLIWLLYRWNKTS